MAVNNKENSNDSQNTREQVNMSLLKSPIDYKSLEEELCKGLQADHLYKLQNDAKIRAVEQNVPTYEHFRQIVNAAHLKPVERTDMKSDYHTSWNLMSNLKNSSILSTELEKQTYGKNESSKSATIIGSKPCKNFLQIWNDIIDSEEKFQYLWQARYALKEIFYVDVPSSCVIQFLNVCLQNLFITDDVSSVIDILTALSECRRFNLAVSFLDNQEKKICSQLFQQLLIKKRDDQLSESTIKSLAAKYYTPLN